MEIALTKYQYYNYSHQCPKKKGKKKKLKRKTLLVHRLTCIKRPVELMFCSPRGKAQKEELDTGFWISCLKVKGAYETPNILRIG